MGVTYKLKDEIIEYILRQKREDSRISCRKLAIIIEENFHIHVSKSSINAVIKEAQLSSPVGRTPVDLNKSKKFSIPKEKKTQLFGGSLTSQEQTAPEPKAQTEKPVLSPQPRMSQINVPLLPGPLIPEEIELQIIENKEDVSADINSFQQPETKEKSETIKLKKDVVGSIEGANLEKRFEVNDMTPLFMRLVLRDFFPYLLLEEFFKRHTSLSKRDMQIVDILFCFSSAVWEDPSVALDPDNRWFWELCGFDELPQKEEVESVIRFLNFERISRFDYFLELAYFCSMVHCVKIVSSNQKEMFVDGRYKFIGPSDAFFPCPIERAVEETARFINGQDIFIIYRPFETNIKSIYEDLLHMCADIKENSIEKIILLGESQQPLLDFTHIPRISRQFILTTWISPEQFEIAFDRALRFISDQKILRAGQELMYIDLSEELSRIDSEFSKKENVWAVAFYHEDLGLAELCLTNILCKSKHINDLEDMLVQFPLVPAIRERGQETEPSFNIQDELITISSGIRSLLQTITGHIDIVFKKGLGNSESFLSLCKIKGFVIFDKGKSKIVLKNENMSEDMKKRTIDSFLSVCNQNVYGSKKILLSN